MRLVNAGGVANVPWTLTGAGQGITVNLTNGNLRAEQEIYLQIDPAAFAFGEHAREIKIAGDGVAGDALRLRFRLGNEDCGLGFGSRSSGSSL